MSIYSGIISAADSFVDTAAATVEVVAVVADILEARLCVLADDFIVVVTFAASDVVD